MHDPSADAALAAHHAAEAEGLLVPISTPSEELLLLFAIQAAAHAALATYYELRAQR